MGCGSSVPVATDQPGTSGRPVPLVVAPDGLDKRERGSGSYRRPGERCSMDRRSLDKPAPPALPPAAAAAAAAKEPPLAERMALALAEGATEGNVHDVYTFGKTLGAQRPAPATRGVVACAVLRERRVLVVPAHRALA